MCIFDVGKLFGKLAPNSSLLRASLRFVSFLFPVLHPRLFGALPPTLHTQAYSLSEFSLSLLDIQLTLAFLEFWKLPLRQMQIRDGAEQKRDFLLHLPSFGPALSVFAK